MGNYENLKQSITEVIRTNGNQEITGAVLQSTLLTIISTVGANATFAGIATPTTNPGTPDGSVFWLAFEGGTYSNFGSIELQDGLSVLTWNGSWSSQQIFGVDNEPTAGSDNLVKSGGVYGIVEYVGGIGEQASYVDINSGYWGKGVKLGTCPIGSTFSEENIELVVAQALAKVDVTGKKYLIIDGIRNSPDSFYSWFVLDGNNKILDGSYLPVSDTPTKFVLDLTVYTGAVLVYVSYQYNKDLYIYYSDTEPIAEKVKNIHILENEVENIKEDTSNIHRLIGPANVEVAGHSVVGTLSYSGTGLKIADNKIGDTLNEQTSFSSCAAQGIEKINIQDKKVVIIQGIRNANNSYYSWFIVDSNNTIIGGSNENYNTPSYLSIDTSVYTDASYLYVSRLYNSSGDIQVWYSDIIPIVDMSQSAAVETIISQGSKNVSAGASTWVSNVFTISDVGAKKGDILVVETNNYCERIVLCTNLNSGMNEKTYITNNNKCITTLYEDVELLRVGAYVKESEGVAIAGTIKWKAYIIHSPINIYSEYINNIQANVLANKLAKEYVPSLFDESVFNFGSQYRGEGIGLLPIYQNGLYPKYTQSATCYDIYGFIVSAGVYSCINVVDVSIGKYLQYIQVEDSNINNHNNTSSFSNLKYNSDDEFPLMFCGDVHSENFTDGLKLTAYRIYKEEATWKAKGLYNINLPSEYGEGKNGVECQSVVNQDKIYIIAKMNNDTTKIKVLQNPSNINTDITLTDEDVIDEFVVNLTTSMMQDAFVYNNILYQIDEKRIIAIDLIEKLVGIANLPTADISEYEGCFVYDGKLYVTIINSARTLWILQKVDFQQTSKLSVVSERPVGRYIGQCVYDSILKKPVYWNGSAWTDALGNILT